jgi:hypothetical protein
MCLWKTGTYRIALLLYYFKLGTIMGVLSMCLVVGLGKGRPGRKLAFSTIKGWSVLPDRDRIGRLSLCLFIDFKNFIFLVMKYKIPQPHKAPSPLSFYNVILISRLLKVHRRCLFYSATTPSFYFPCWLETELGLSLEGTGNQQKILVIL